MKHKRLKPTVRKDAIITVALALASDSHYQKLTRDQIATAAEVSGPAIQYHFKTMTRLRGEIMRAAVKRECLPVIAQGVLAKDPQAAKAPNDLQCKALLDNLPPLLRDQEGPTA